MIRQVLTRLRGLDRLAIQEYSFRSKVLRSRSNPDSASKERVYTGRRHPGMIYYVSQFKSAPGRDLMKHKSLLKRNVLHIVLNTIQPWSGLADLNAAIPCLFDRMAGSTWWEVGTLRSVLVELGGRDNSIAGASVQFKNDIKWMHYT